MKLNTGHHQEQTMGMFRRGSKARAVLRGTNAGLRPAAKRRVRNEVNEAIAPPCAVRPVAAVHRLCQLTTVR
jgi:hypothetical protein